MIIHFESLIDIQIKFVLHLLKRFGCPNLADRWTDSVFNTFSNQTKNLFTRFRCTNRQKMRYFFRFPRFDVIVILSFHFHRRLREICCFSLRLPLEIVKWKLLVLNRPPNLYSPDKNIFFINNLFSSHELMRIFY